MDSSNDSIREIIQTLEYVESELTSDSLTESSFAALSQNEKNERLKALRAVQGNCNDIAAPFRSVETPNAQKVIDKCEFVKRKIDEKIEQLSIS